MNTLMVAAMSRKLKNTAGGVDGVYSGGGEGAKPSSPTMLETTGSLVGQMTVMFWKPDYLQDGEPIADAPVTGTVVYVSSSEANAVAGTFSHSGSAGTSEQVTITGIAAGTWYVWAVSSNANGQSDPSHILPVTVT
jgi:hypothetical protein